VERDAGPARQLRPPGDPEKPFDTIEVLQLASALTEKWRLARESRSLLDELEQRVCARTAELEIALAGHRRAEQEVARINRALKC